MPTAPRPYPPHHPLRKLLGNRTLVLGSGSPRRSILLEGLGLQIEVRPPTCDESYPDTLPHKQVPLYLARQKADSLRTTLTPNEVLITADTVVLLGGSLIGKPHDLDDARHILGRLSGSTHDVITGYTLTTTHEQRCGEARSSIRFAPLEGEEIDYYLAHYQVLDKAGAYGVQDWIGLVGVQEIVGSYHNIMGLPTALLYRDLKALLEG